MALKELICPHCNGHVHIEPGRGNGTVYCSYCGQTLYFDSGQQNKNVNVNQYSHKRYTDDAEVIRAKTEYEKPIHTKNTLKWVFAVIVLIASLIMLVRAVGYFDEQADLEAGFVSAGSYKDLIGEDYRSVKAHFESAGFTNIKMVHLDDSWWNDGEVTMISIGGKTKFKASDRFAPDTLVVISYH